MNMDISKISYIVNNIIIIKYIIMIHTNLVDQFLNVKKCYSIVYEEIYPLIKNLIECIFLTFPAEATHSTGNEFHKCFGGYSLVLRPPWTESALQ